MLHIFLQIINGNKMLSTTLDHGFVLKAFNCLKSELPTVLGGSIRHHIGPLIEESYSSSARVHATVSKV